MLAEIAVFFFGSLWRTVSLTNRSLALNPPLVTNGSVCWWGSSRPDGEAFQVSRSHWHMPCIMGPASGAGASERVRLIELDPNRT